MRAFFFGAAFLIAIELLTGCGQSHERSDSRLSVLVQRQAFDAALGVPRWIPAVGSHVIVWSCDEAWSDEAEVDEVGLAVFDSHDVPSCWGVTAVDPNGKVARTMLIDEVPPTIEGEGIPRHDALVRLPGSAEVPSYAVEFHGQVLNLPAKTDALSLVSDRYSLELDGEPSIESGVASFAATVSYHHPVPSFNVVAYAMRDGLPVNGALVSLVSPVGADVLEVEIELPITPVPIETAEFTMSLPTAADFPFAHGEPCVGSAWLGWSQAGYVRFETDGETSEWAGEAAWIDFAGEGRAPSLRTCWTLESDEGTRAELHASGSIPTLSAAEFPPIEEPIVGVTHADVNGHRLVVAVGQEGSGGTSLVLSSPGTGYQWEIWRRGRIELDDFPQLPSGMRPSDLLGDQFDEIEYEASMMRALDAVLDDAPTAFSSIRLSGPVELLATD